MTCLCSDNHKFFLPSFCASISMYKNICYGVYSISNLGYSILKYSYVSPPNYEETHSAFQFCKVLPFCFMLEMIPVWLSSLLSDQVYFQDHMISEVSAYRAVEFIALLGAHVTIKCVCQFPHWVTWKFNGMITDPKVRNKFLKVCNCNVPIALIRLIIIL